MRADKFLWCVRLTKTRALAAEACEKGRVKCNEAEAKPSKELRFDDIISMRETPIWRTFQILDIPKSRVGPKLVPDFLLETTPSHELERLHEMKRLNLENKSLGTIGRPTKKARRNLDDFRKKS
jgi:ribosome-associated heat shock protein Hsp15